MGTGENSAESGNRDVDITKRRQHAPIVVFSILNISIDTCLWSKDSCILYSCKLNLVIFLNLH